MSALSPETLTFRQRIIEALWPPDGSGCVYIGSDRFVMRCPICGDAVGVRFHGYAERADLHCWGGCTERMLAAVIRRTS